MYEQSLCKVKILRNEYCGSYRLHKLGTPKMLRADGRSGPTTRPAFAKATQVKAALKRVFAGLTRNALQ